MNDPKNFSYNSTYFVEFCTLTVAFKLNITFKSLMKGSQHCLALMSYKIGFLLTY